MSAAGTVAGSSVEARGFRHGLALPALFLGIAMFNLTLPVVGLKELIIDRLGGTARDASLFFSVEMLAYLLFAPLWGLLSDRVRRRKPLIVAGFLASAGLYLAFMRVTAVGPLLALRFVQGACTVAGWSTLMALVVDQAGPLRRGRSMGIMGAALTLGVSLGAPLGGYLTRDLGPDGPLRIAALLFLLIGLGSLALPESGAGTRQVVVSEILAALRARPRLAVPYLFYFVDRFTVGLYVVVFPLYLGSLGVTDPAVRGRYLSVFLLPFALLQVLSGWVAERLGPIKPLVLGSLAYGAVLTTVGFSSLFGLWWVMLTLGVLAALMFTPTLMLTAQIAPAESRASAMAGFNVAGSLGFALGPYLGTLVYQAQGAGVAFAAAGGLEVLCAIVGLILVRRLAGARDGQGPAASAVS